MRVYIMMSVLSGLAGGSPLEVPRGEVSGGDDQGAQPFCGKRVHVLRGLTGREGGGRGRGVRG